jgi:hypothetical protein
MNGHHANVGALLRAIDCLYRAGVDVDPLNRLPGEGGPGRTDVKNQPLAVRSPDARIGQLMMARSKSDLFHRATLMHGVRIRV